MIAYSQPDVVEKRESVDDWHILPPLPAKPVRHAACEAEIKEWFTKEQINAYLRDLAMYMSRHPITLIADNQPTLEQRFSEQANIWDQETMHISSPLQRMTHPSYQAILGMAAENKKDVIRLMLRDMQRNRRDWFLALSYLTQANPLNPKDAGKTDKLINAWVGWGKEQGILER